MKFSLGKIILLLVHVALLLPMIVVGSSDFFIAAILSVVLFFVFVGNLRTQHQEQDISSFVPFLVVLGGASTYFLSVELNLGTVIAASLVGFIASFLPSVIKSAQHAPAAIYCGSFVGMCSPMIAPNYTFVVLACLFSGGIYLLVKNDLNGIGGKLGTIAFSGVVLLTLLIQLMK